MFRSLVHFELILCVWCKVRSKFSPRHGVSGPPTAIYCKDCPRPRQPVSAPSLEVICPCTRGLLLGSRSCPVGLCVRLCATAATYGPLALRRRRVVGLHLCALMCTHHLFSFDQSECPLCVVAGSGHGDLTEGNCASPKCRRERRLGHFRGGTSGGRAELLPPGSLRARSTRHPCPGGGDILVGGRVSSTEEQAWPSHRMSSGMKSRSAGD